MKDKTQKKSKKNRSWISTAILLFILLLGAGIIAYPTISDWWNSFHQSRAIASYAQTVETTDTTVMDQMLADAEAYNAELLTKENRYVLSEEEAAEYGSLLDLEGNGVMGYVQINSIGVSLPLYHGTTEAVLQSAVGHIEGTSLPVGGQSTHAVLSGHRGLPSAKLFTDLDKVVEGDVFTITVLNRVLTYEVDQIRIVEPSDMSNLNIISGGDYCTLVTCTPYGINTHRLLVRGHRIENIAGDVVVTAGAIKIPYYLVIPAVGVPLLFILLLGMLIYYSIRRSSRTQDELLALLQQARAADLSSRFSGGEADAPEDGSTDPPPDDGGAT